MNPLMSLSARVLRAFSALPPDENSCPTALPWLSFIRFTHPTALNKGMLSPSMCLILQGQKRC